MQLDFLSERLCLKNPKQPQNTTQTKTPKHNPNQKKQPEREKLQMILLSIFKKTACEKIL